MTSFASWCSEQVVERDLDGYARERAEEALRSDPTLSALWEARNAADDRQSAMRTFDGTVEPDAVDTLVEARRATGDALRTLADRVVREAVEAVEVHGHTVDLRHATRLDCPACDEDGVEAFHLGHTDRDGDEVVGWVCGHCGATVEESRETGEVEAVETEGSA